ncbi:hypothetical protein DV702_04930 [Sporosarcina sp. PTS2304]|uniref:CueP family metal-binding protein n=1 Tax=Sporosarcina sp. PTS2304 TaxID=2283194 RepID=UPI000E0D0FAE|nr:CueP family metal-binding protein [Sporosarcina sp. PTS2304]AXH99136.1 hypothetical protein DV702_04930 [Sporosarcina sp. PTS2304]
MNIRWIVLGLLMALLSAGCSNEQTNDDTPSPEVEIKQLVNDYTVRNAVAASASITSSELIVTDENKQVTTYDLPEDEFFVSIAPFVTSTHPCDIHSLTGCQGELVEEEFTVHIKDSQGHVVVDEIKKTEANGFIDLWLPRDETFTVTISQDDKKSVSDITTFDGDNTCITTMQLQ